MIFNKRLSKEDQENLLEVSRMVNMYKFVGEQIKGNTALVRNGQGLAKEYQSIASLLDKVKSNMVSQALTKAGYPQGVNFSVNLRTGKVKKQ